MPKTFDDLMEEVKSIPADQLTLSKKAFVEFMRDAYTVGKLDGNVEAHEDEANIINSVLSNRVQDLR